MARSGHGRCNAHLVPGLRRNAGPVEWHRNAADRSGALFRCRRRDAGRVSGPAGRRQRRSRPLSRHHRQPEPVAWQRQGRVGQQRQEGKVAPDVRLRVRRPQPLPAALCARGQSVHSRTAGSGAVRRQRLRARGRQRCAQRLRQQQWPVGAAGQHCDQHRSGLSARRQSCGRPEFVLRLCAGDQPHDGRTRPVRDRPGLPLRRGHAAILLCRAHARDAAQRLLHARQSPRPRGQPVIKPDRRMECLQDRRHQRRQQRRWRQSRPLPRRLPAHRRRHLRHLPDNQRLPVDRQRLRRRADLRAVEVTARGRCGQRDHGAPRHHRPGQRTERCRLDTTRLHRVAGAVAGLRFVQPERRRHRVLHELERGRRSDSSRSRIRRQLRLEPARRLDADEHLLARQRFARAQPEQQGARVQYIRDPAEAGSAGRRYAAGHSGAAGPLLERHDHDTLQRTSRVFPSARRSTGA